MINNTLHNVRGVVKPWLWLWLPPALLLAVIAATQRQTTLRLVGEMLLGLAVSLILHFARSWARVLLLAVLLLLAISGIVAWDLSKYTWSQATNIALLPVLRQQQEETIHGTGARKWRVSPGAGLELSFDARLTGGMTGWDWIRSEPDFKLQPREENGQMFTHVTTPLGKDPYLMRTFDTGAPTGGHTFKVTLAMRAPQPIPAKGCRGVWLQVWYEGGGRKCLAVSLDSRWKTFTLTWTVPQGAKSPVIRVVLNDFDGLSYDVRDVQLYERTGQGWRQLAPLVPAGAYMQVSGEKGLELASVSFLPTAHWQHFSFPLLKILKKKPRGSSITVVVHAAESANNPFAFETRNVKLANINSSAAAPAPRPVPLASLTHMRQSLYFNQPNLAGHTVTALGLAALSTLYSGWLGLVTLALSVFTIWLTGSRAAWLAAFIGLPRLLWLVCRRRELWWVFSALIAAAAAFFILFGADTLGRLQLFNTEDINPVSRPEIWRTALQAFTSHFWTGIGAENFTAYWHTRHPGTPAVTHAHDLWLQFAASAGIFGLLAILWLTAGFVYLAWRWERWRGLGLILPVLLMNVFDYTFFYAGVLFPLILGMNALQESKSQTERRRPSAPVVE